MIRVAAAALFGAWFDGATGTLRHLVEAWGAL